MAQQLIVEGNDAISIANLLKKRRLLPPEGYHEPVKFRDEFIKNAGGFNKVPKALEEALDNPALTNIGVIVDANDAGAEKRWDTIIAVLTTKLDPESIEKHVESGSGKIIKAEHLTIGIWIMPDNQNNGYLEHFLSSLIPAEDKIWPFVQKQVDALKQQGLQVFSDAKKQKALLHTWLAWQKEPGKPFGQAAELGYFDVNSPMLENFEQWFRATFILSKPKSKLVKTPSAPSPPTNTLSHNPQCLLPASRTVQRIQCFATWPYWLR